MPFSFGPWAASFSSRHQTVCANPIWSEIVDWPILHSISATEAARLIRYGVISSEQFVEACLARIAEVDGQVQAWTFLDREYALQQARAADQRRLTGAPTGPLHGVPI